MPRLEMLNQNGPQKQLDAIGQTRWGPPLGHRSRPSRRSSSSPRQQHHGGAPGGGVGRDWDVPSPHAPDL